MTAPIEAAQVIGRGVGRHFSIVSMLPAVLLASWLALLTISGAWAGRPNLDRIVDRTAAELLTDGAWILVVALALALILHPLVFATTRLLEGYWGASRLAVGAMSVRITHHRERARVLDAKAARYRAGWRRMAQARAQEAFDSNPRRRINPATASPDQLAMILRAEVSSDMGDYLMPFVVGEQEARRLAAGFPADPGRTMPTRLGNALRTFEDALGRPYGIVNGIHIIPHLQLVAPQEHLDIIRDARTGMDRAIALCTTWLLAFGATGLALFTDGWWLLITLVPYGLAYLSYRGAIAGAREYGRAVTTVLDVDRFLLYQRLQLIPPGSHQMERRQNSELVRMLTEDADTSLTYRAMPAPDQLSAGGQAG